MPSQTSSTRRLIVNADDFGLSHGVNRGIMESHENGILTSASLMVRWPAAKEAVEYARSHPRLSLGIHLDFGEWIFRDGEWRALYTVVDDHDPIATQAEVNRQIQMFLDLVGQPPTHIDSHQHVHREARVLPFVKPHAQKFNAVLRHVDPRVRYDGGFYGQDDFGGPFHDALRPDVLVKTICALPEGVTELGCHPGYDEALQTMYRRERAMEVATLCSPVVRQAVEEAQIQLINFADLR